MRLLVPGITLLAALATMPTTAQAQQAQNAAQIGQHIAPSNPKTDEVKVKANEKAYNSALKNLPDKQYDPWRGVR